MHTRPPESWGVRLDDASIARLADRWGEDEFPLPAFDYPGTPADRDEAWWYDYVTLAVSVLACLWPPEGDEMWRIELDGEWLDDAPGIFAVFTRAMRVGGLSVDHFASLSPADGAALFAGRGTLQLIPERIELLRSVGASIQDAWGGTARHLVEDAGHDATGIVDRLIDTVPGYRDRPVSSEGELCFDKLAHLAAAIMGAGRGWRAGGFHGFENFPVYPDYMLPRIFRHFGVMVYDADLAAQVDSGQLIAAESPAELGIRWATIWAGEQLRQALSARRSPDRAVLAPALDYRLWSEAVLGPDAADFGLHHRTITLRY